MDLKKGKKDIALVYMVAGMSSRFGGKIKQFAKVGREGETLIEVSLQQALRYGFSKIVFIVGEKTEKPFKEMFGEEYKGIQVYYVFQGFDKNVRKKPWGSADAVVRIKEVVNCDFVVCNGDDLYGDEAFRKIVEHLETKEGCATIGYRLGDVLPEEGFVNRGIFKVKNNKVEELKEEIGIALGNLEEKSLTEDSLCSMNIFGLREDVLIFLEEEVNKFKEKNKNSSDVECYLPVELSNLLKNRKITMDIYETRDKWLGVTNPEDEEIVRKELMKGFREVL